MVTVTIHGIGNSGPDYNAKWKVSETLGIPAKDVKAFYYEDVMDKDGISIVAKLAASAAARYYAPQLAGIIDSPVDYLEDIFVFFLSPAARKKIDAQLRWALQPYDDIRILGHSLGSIIAYWFLLNNPDLAIRTELVTLGSPLGSRLLSSLVKFWLKRISKTELARPVVRRWVNISSVLDPLSGFIFGLGCDKKDQEQIPFAKKVLHHEVDKYIQAYRQDFYLPPDEPMAVA